MERKIIATEDGSHTIFIPEMNEHYHSTHGAIQESVHVFIESGLKHVNKNEINVLEVGFGTGLNAWLSLLECGNQLKINYYTIEKYPLNQEEYLLLNYCKTEQNSLFNKLHQCSWNNTQNILSNFTITKFEADITTIDFKLFPKFDLIYFDAFAPNKQSDSGIWTKEIFKKIFDKCSSNAIFVTYCAQGQVRRDLQEVGFKVERIPGPPGKREMLRGIVP